MHEISFTKCSFVSLVVRRLTKESTAARRLLLQIINGLFLHLLQYYFYSLRILFIRNNSPYLPNALNHYSKFDYVAIVNILRQSHSYFTKKIKHLKKVTLLLHFLRKSSILLIIERSPNALIRY